MFIPTTSIISPDPSTEAFYDGSAQSNCDTIEFVSDHHVSNPTVEASLRDIALTNGTIELLSGHHGHNTSSENRTVETLLELSALNSASTIGFLLGEDGQYASLSDLQTNIEMDGSVSRIYCFFEINC